MSYINNMDETIEKQTRDDFEIKFMQNYKTKYKTKYNTAKYVNAKYDNMGMNRTHVDFESMQVKDNTIKRLREEILNLKEEIEDLKKDIKSFIEMES